MFIIQVNTENGCTTMLVLLIHDTDVNQFLGIKAYVFTNFKREVECPKLAEDCLRPGFYESLLTRNQMHVLNKSAVIIDPVQIPSSTWFDVDRNVMYIEVLCQ